MWLLSTSRAELYFFVSPESVPGGYAILSHVWDPSSEQSFQSIQGLRVSCAETGLNPRDHVSDKIRECCKLAEQYGHDWLWVDTCCIDKTSSTELSEAVNSMFRYYSLANVCYAFLADVPTAGIATLSQDKSAFRTSRWHKRGWTLQELLGPPVLFFVSETWEILGSKAELNDVLEEITRVPSGVLLNQEKFSDTSIAQRMSWAAGRETTRPEDEAYCLMGIFGVNMPTLYGEGRRAFRRLQQEIMKQCVDTSLFAWSNTPSETVPNLVRIDPRQLGGCPSGRDIHDVDTRFLADSPLDFAGAAGTKCALIDPTGLQPLVRSRLSNVGSVLRAKASESKSSPDVPTFEINPYGVRAHIPLLQIEHLQLGILFSYKVDPDCTHQQHLALLLSPCSAEPNPILESFPLYCIGLRIKYHQTPQNLVLFHPRTALLEGDLKSLQFYGRTAKWTDVYIRDDPLPESALSPTTIAACLRSGDEVDLKRYLWLSQLLRVNSHFHFAWDSMGHLLRRGYSLTLFQPHQGTLVLEMKEAAQPGIWIVLGRCRRRDAEDAVSGQVPAYPHWARLILRPYGTDPLQSTAHDCENDHIRDWSGMERTFKYYDNHGFYSVKLSFTPALDEVLKIRVSPIKSIQPFPEDRLSAFPDPPRDRRHSGVGKHSLGKLMFRWHST